MGRLISSKVKVSKVCIDIFLVVKVLLFGWCCLWGVIVDMWWIVC